MSHILSNRPYSHKRFRAEVSKTLGKNREDSGQIA